MQSIDFIQIIRLQLEQICSPFCFTKSIRINKAVVGKVYSGEFVVISVKLKPIHTVRMDASRLRWPLDELKNTEFRGLI